MCHCVGISSGQGARGRPLLGGAALTEGGWGGGGCGKTVGGAEVQRSGRGTRRGAGDKPERTLKLAAISMCGGKGPS